MPHLGEFAGKLRRTTPEQHGKHSGGFYESRGKLPRVGRRMTAQIFQFPTPRSNDLMRRMDSLSRDALYLYQAALVLALSAVELQLAMMGFHDRTRL